MQPTPNPVYGCRVLTMAAVYAAFGLGLLAALAFQQPTRDAKAQAGPTVASPAKSEASRSGAKPLDSLDARSGAAATALAVGTYYSLVPGSPSRAAGGPAKRLEDEHEPELRSPFDVPIMPEAK
jgi:hypothetical protein